MRGAVLKLRVRGFATHYWIVVSNPHLTTNRVLAFNITDVCHYPESRCILEPGEHECIKIRSAVRYFSPKIWDVGTLQDKIDDGTFERFSDASEELIQQIIDGAYEDDTPENCFEYLPPRTT